MNDRELLELAAKAYGLVKPLYITDGLQLGWRIDEGISVDSGPTCARLWNPLTDDGDALRLAVTLGIRVGCDDTRAHCDWWAADGITLHDLQEIVVGGDKLTATRRAIVRAAAEIGKGLP